MAVKAWGAGAEKKAKTLSAKASGGGASASGRGAVARQLEPADSSRVEEIFFSNDAVSLCLLVNRRVKTMRVIDFRAGPTNAKRMFVLSLAHREGVEKVYTLVERDEVATWVKLGFAKEGNIPGFYKRSDAFMLGCSVSAAANGRAQLQSEMRLAARAPITMRPPRDANGRLRFDSEPPRILEPEPEPVEEIVDTRAHDFAEKTLVKAKKAAKELADKSFPVAKIVPMKDADVKKPLAAALKAGRALTAFEPFGRDVQRRYFNVTARGGFELIVSTESQACFGNAFLELLTAPKNDAERLATTSALKTLCDRLLAEGVVTCFALAPSDDIGLATAFVYNGFRRTGLLQNHIVVGNERKDVIIFSRKLANPADE
jgi:hypothetical protein